MLHTFMYMHIRRVGSPIKVAVGGRGVRWQVAREYESGGQLPPFPLSPSYYIYLPAYIIHNDALDYKIMLV